MNVRKYCGLVDCKPCQQCVDERKTPLEQTVLEAAELWYMNGNGDPLASAVARLVKSRKT